MAYLGVSLLLDMSGTSGPAAEITLRGNLLLLGIGRCFWWAIPFSGALSALLGGFL